MERVGQGLYVVMPAAVNVEECERYRAEVERRLGPEPFQEKWGYRGNVVEKVQQLVAFGSKAKVQGGGVGGGLEGAEVGSQGEAPASAGQAGSGGSGAAGSTAEAMGCDAGPGVPRLMRTPGRQPTRTCWKVRRLGFGFASRRGGGLPLRRKSWRIGLWRG